MDIVPEDIAFASSLVKCRRTFPSAFARALDSGTLSDTARVFLNCGGVAAWAAYSLIERAANSKGHVASRAQKRHVFERINILSVEACQTFATQLASELRSHEATIEQLIQRPHKRRRAYQRQRQVSRASRPETGDDSNGGIDDDGKSTPTSTPLVNSSSIASQEQSTQSHAALQQQHRTAEQDADENIYVDCSVSACDRLFPPYLAGAIKRDIQHDHRFIAAISISFPRKGNPHALLSVEIHPTRVEHIAWMLFRVHVENEAGLRYLCVDSVKVIPTPSIGLQRCRLACISELFGECMASAIFANPTYQQERLGEENFTSCVGMYLPMAAEEPAKICISLHPREGALLKRLLFKSANIPK